jgi:hypothetical protein
MKVAGPGRKALVRFPQHTGRLLVGPVSLLARM